MGTAQRIQGRINLVGRDKINGQSLGPGFDEFHWHWRTLLLMRQPSVNSPVCKIGSAR